METGSEDTYSLCGIELEPTMTLPVKNVKINDNQIIYERPVESSSPSQIYYKSGIALYLGGTNTLENESIDVHDNTIIGATCAGIFVGMTVNHLSVRRNTIIDCWNQTSSPAYNAGVYVISPNMKNVYIHENTIVDTRTSSKLARGVSVLGYNASSTYEGLSIRRNEISYKSPITYEYLLATSASTPIRFEGEVESLYEIYPFPIVYMATGSEIIERGNGIVHKAYCCSGLYGEGQGAYSSAPIKYYWAKGDRAINVDATSGISKAWVNTVTGGADTARADNTAYSVGDWIEFIEGTTVWECTTAGTTAATPPDITGIAIGGTLEDGTAVWIKRATTAAAFINEGNL